ncbi:MAG: DUF192 domain-containing protein [Leptolyngbya sp. SIOISBB]|nr:DUF192 domain-containing protein [Leptolyngbya sp. SIOISBB]
MQFRESLAPNHGMFFPLEQARTPEIWMKDVPIALDIVFLSEGEIVAIVEAAPPCSLPGRQCATYRAEVPVDAVLEMTGGAASRLGLELGQAIVVQELQLK